MPPVWKVPPQGTPLHDWWFHEPFLAHFISWFDWQKPSWLMLQKPSHDWATQRASSIEPLAGSLSHNAIKLPAPPTIAPICCWFSRAIVSLFRDNFPDNLIFFIIHRTFNRAPTLKSFSAYACHYGLLACTTGNN